MNKEKNILLKLFWAFFKIGAFTFGGGYAMIALLDKECVEKRGWITSEELMDVTVVAESTPGPIAINCATYTGYKVGGFIGSLMSTLGIVLPSFTIIYIISLFFEDLLSYTVVANVFKGIQVAVSILIVQAAWKMINKSMKKMKKKGNAICIIVTFFTIVLVTNIMGIHFSSIWLILISGIIGYFLYYKYAPKQGGGKQGNMNKQANGGEAV